MKKYIAYFDYLGFKQVVENNDIEQLKHIVSNNLRDIEAGLGKGKTKKTKHGVIADLTQSKINCINFSDTVIFWSNDDSIESLVEILEVSYRYNWQSIDFTFPVRGALLFDEIHNLNFQHNNYGGGTYNINSVIGKGIVNAHFKAESQLWAGTVIDETFVQEIRNRGYNPSDFLKPFAKLFPVPYKDQKVIQDEYVLCIIEGEEIPQIAYENYKNEIINNFKAYNKSIDNLDVKVKIENTLSFLKSFCKE